LSYWGVSDQNINVIAHFVLVSRFDQL